MAPERGMMGFNVGFDFAVIKLRERPGEELNKLTSFYESDSWEFLHFPSTLPSRPSLNFQTAQLWQKSKRFFEIPSFCFTFETSQEFASLPSDLKVIPLFPRMLGESLVEWAFHRALHDEWHEVFSFGFHSFTWKPPKQLRKSKECKRHD